MIPHLSEKGYIRPPAKVKGRGFFVTPISLERLIVTQATRTVRCLSEVTKVGKIIHVNQRLPPVAKAMSVMSFCILEGSPSTRLSYFGPARLAAKFQMNAIAKHGKLWSTNAP